jgi:hypothetical protein
VPTPWKTALTVVVLALAFGAGGYWLGRDGAERADWHTVTIERADVVSNGGAHRLLTVNVDGWAYALENAVPHWIDEAGSVHDSGWPHCLEPAHPGGGPERNPGHVTFRFASVAVRTEAIGWRPVVAVDCRP